MKYALAALLLLASAAAIPAGTTATVSFSPVTEYVDNSPLPATDILKYTVKWAGGSLDVTSPAMCPTGGKICVPVPVPCGDRSFTVTVTTKATAKYANATAPDSAPPAAYASEVACTPKQVQGVSAS